jgi:hypothetical protein
MITLVSIPKDKIEASWFRVEQLITEALIRSGGYANSNHFKDWCIENKCQLWILWDAEETVETKKLYGVVITEVIQRPLQKSCHIRIMTGHHREKWQHLIKDIEKFAYHNDCDKMELIARPGWEKVLRNFRYKKSHVLLEKQLKKG